MAKLLHLKSNQQGGHYSTHHERNCEYGSDILSLQTGNNNNMQKLKWALQVCICCVFARCYALTLSLQKADRYKLLRKAVFYKLLKAYYY